MAQMKISDSFISSPLSFLWSSLKPIFLVFIILVVIATSLVVYDQYRAYQERKMGAKLIKNVEVRSSCDEIVNAGEKFNFVFSTYNKTGREIALEKIGIDVNILGIRNKNFTQLLSTKPTSLESKESPAQFKDYVFPTPVKILPHDKKTFALHLQAASKKEAQASSHTIVVYRGTVAFYFNYDMTIRSDCQIQVRYP